VAWEFCCYFPINNTQCLKIIEKVAFNIASENLKLTVKQCYQTLQYLIGQKLVEKAKIEKVKRDILSNFQTQSQYWKPNSLLHCYIEKSCVNFSVEKRKFENWLPFIALCFSMKKEWLIKNYKILELHVSEERTSHEGRRKQRDELHFKYRSQS